MNYIKSCGFVAYKRIENQNYYLIIKGLNGEIGFPKGHMEIGESELQTAIRELKEETGIEVNTVSGFRRQIEYPLSLIPNTVKQSVYFLGKCISYSIIPQETEIAEAKFVSYEDALNVLAFKETKDILRDAESFINVNEI